MGCIPVYIRLQPVYRYLINFGGSIFWWTFGDFRDFYWVFGYFLSILSIFFGDLKIFGDLYTSIQFQQYTWHIPAYSFVYWYTAHVVIYQERKGMGATKTLVLVRITFYGIKKCTVTLKSSSKQIYK